MFYKKEPQPRDIPAPQLSFNSDITELAQFQRFVVGLSPAHRPVRGEQQQAVALHILHSLGVAGQVQFAGIPTFSPEHFARIEQKDTMKRKQFVKGMEQIAQEGAIQIFREVGGGMEEVVVGVVGVLQLEVLEYRLNTEYNVEIRMQQLPFEQLRWVQNDPDTYNLRDLDLTSDTKAVEDMKGNRLLLFTSDWAIRWAETHNEELKLSEFGNI